MVITGIAPLSSVVNLRLLILGLHAAGKIAFLYKLKLGDIVTTIPTIGFNVESITYKNLTFTMWDSGGSCGLRRQWRHFYQDTAGIIFLVDSNDRDRISEAREDLHRMSNEDTLCDAVFLIIANKQDIPGYMTVMEVYEALRLDQLAKIGKQRVHIQPCSVLQRQGMEQGMEWLSRQLAKD
ncbi:MAG: small ARF-related GTPase [Podila humilis]|nr:MAG: small ARF-related GTPase [Podila humilis]